MASGYGVLAGVTALAPFAALELAARRADSGLLPGLWFDPVADFKHRQISQLAQSGFAPDVVAIGHSIVFDMFDPTEFSEHVHRRRFAYNAGINLAAVHLVLDWYRAVLDIWSPSAVVMAFTSADLNSNGSNQPQLLERHRATVAGRTRGLLADQPVIRPSPVSAAWRHRTSLRRRWFWRAVKRGSRALPEAARLIGPLGQDLHKIGKSYVCNEGFERAFTDRWLVDYKIGEPEVQAVQSVLDVVKASGALPFFVWPRYSSDFPRMHPRGQADLDDTRDALADLLHRNGLVLRIPPRDIVTDSDFADPVHLAPAGTRKMTRWIASELALTC